MINIRKPTVGDVETIFNLTSRMAGKGLMLHRSKYKIITMLQNFLVAEDEETGKVIGCGAFILLWTDLGEVVALAIEEEYQGKGVGKRIVKELLSNARRMQVPEVITLTYKPGFFKKIGFSPADKDRYPRKIWGECLECPKLEQCDETMLHIMMNEEIDIG
ncbi:MAG: N-acetyltransferase [Spirochaetales bacterium]|nr:N-acetyltransferase [Spirochaetales bacterium]